MKSNKLTALNVLNYIFIFVAWTWPFLASDVFFGIDAAGRVPMTLTFITFFANFFSKNRLFMLDRPYVFWMLWTVYAVFNYWAKKPVMADDPVTFCIGRFSILMVLYVSAWEYMERPKRFLMFVTFVCFAIGLFTIDSEMLRNQLQGNAENLGDHYISEFGNVIPLQMVILTFFLILAYFKNYLKLLPTVVFFLSVAFFIIIVSATRKAFGGIVIIVFFSFLPYFMRRSWRSVAALALFYLAYLGVNYLLDNTFLGERSIEIYEQETFYEKGTFLYYMGDRAFMYVEGWQLFLENMWTGIGLRNFMDVAQSDYVLHTEYMVQLTECGIIGAALYLAFNVSIIIGLIKAALKKVDFKQTLVCLGLMAAILFISFTAWTYTFTIYFIGLGIVIGHYKLLNNKNSETKPHEKVEN